MQMHLEIKMKANYGFHNERKLFNYLRDIFVGRPEFLIDMQKS